MKSSNAKKIKLTSYNDIFNIADEKQNIKNERIQEISLSELYEFTNHPFKVIDDEKMDETVKSIKEYGVLVPAIARQRENGGYELISGHRRKRASEIAGLKTMPVIVRNLNDDEATIIMVDSNIQRENLLYSEKAFAYKMKLDAVKHQGFRSDLKAYNKVGGVKEIGEEAGDSIRQVQRFIRLTELIKELLEYVDNKKLSFNAAVDISYLNKEEQADLLEIIKKSNNIPSLSQSVRLKKYSSEGKLDKNVIEIIMTEEEKAVNKVTISREKLGRYFPKEYTQKQIEDIIYKLLEDWSGKEE